MYGKTWDVTAIAIAGLGDTLSWGNTTKETFGGGSAASARFVWEDGSRRVDG